MPRKKPAPPIVPETLVPTTPLASRGLRIPEAAAYIGSTIWFVRELIWTRKVPAIRLGKRDVLLREDLDRYLDEQRRVA